MEPLVAVRGLRKDRPQGRSHVYRLECPVLDVPAGGRVLLTGPSGCGKSTLLDVIALILKPDAVDSFVFLGHDLAGLMGDDAAGDALASSLRRRIGYVLQTGGLLPFCSVLENILLARRLADLPLDDWAERTAESLGIAQLLGKNPSALSVGERQRAAIAAALAGEPALVLADEPTAALDPRNADIVLELLTETVAKAGAALVLVTHAPERVPAGFRRLAIVPEGRENGVGRACVREAD